MINAPFYIKKLEVIGTKTVWLVDGEYIRKNINENFVEYDEHYHLGFIPKDEFWIDQCTNESEYYFFINHMLNEQSYREQGASYADAMKKADHREKKERAKIYHIESKGINPDSRVALIEQIHKKRFPINSESIQVWIVDGELVRNYFFVEYADGGHDRVYTFIPKNEIWLEETLSEKEIPFILLHELHERFLMGQGKDYTHAHRGATEVEDHYRNHPSEVAARIKEEIVKNA